MSFGIKFQQLKYFLKGVGGPKKEKTNKPQFNVVAS